MKALSMPKFYAHTKTHPDGSLCDKNKWEPLFTEDCKALQGEHCPRCETLDPQHGHLNKVAYLCSKFAAEMLPVRTMVIKSISFFLYFANLPS